MIIKNFIFICFIIIQKIHNLQYGKYSNIYENTLKLNNQEFENRKKEIIKRYII